MTTYLLLILLSLLVLHVVLRYNKSARAINKIPGPTSFPFIGNMLQLNVSGEELWLLFRQYANEYYPIFRAWFTARALIFIRHPDDVKILLSSKKNINKSSFYDNLAVFGGDGIILSKDEKWRQRRKIMNPAFSPTLLQNHLKVSNQYIINLMMHIKSEGDETIQELLSLFGKLTFEIICESTMGVDLSKTESEGGEKYRHGLEIISNVTLYRVVRPYIKDWMMNWLSLGQKQNHAIGESRIFRDKVIAERKKYLEQTESTMNKYIISNDKTNDGYNGGNRKKPLLDILLSAEKKGVIDRQGVGEEVDNLIAAGYDTTSLALCYTLMLLAENKKAQDIARAEVFEVCNQVGGKITASEIQKFEYLDRCVKESLRLFPIAPHVGRCITEGLQLRDYFIPANTDVIINIFDLHRDSKFWIDPEKFDPDRFLPEQVQNRHPFAYIPFSGGLRNCIGQKYAMMTLKTVLAYILYNFYLEPIDRTSSLRQLSLSVALYPGRPIRTKFIKIKNI